MLWLFSRKRRRERIRSRPFRDAWRAIMERNVPYYRALPPDDRRELEGHVLVFLAEKNFEGCGGLAMTDEIRITIAAQACVLLLHRETDYYPGLGSILVYPDAFVAKTKVVGPAGVVTEGQGIRLGESWKGVMSTHGGGPVVLSWRAAREGALNGADGHNVVYHEFAHQLDGESGAVEGVPALGSRSAYAGWARIMHAAYQNLLEDLRAQRPTVINGYGASSPAEFFAVVTEAFFERPAELKSEQPQLYAQLARFFRQDPASLFAHEHAW